MSFPATSFPSLPIAIIISKGKTLGTRFQDWITRRGVMDVIEICTTPITTARKRPWSFSISNFLLVRSWCRFRAGSAWKQPPSFWKMDLTKVLEATVSPGKLDTRWEWPFEGELLENACRVEAHGRDLAWCLFQVSNTNWLILCLFDRIDQNELQAAQTYLEQAAQANLVS